MYAIGNSFGIVVKNKDLKTATDVIPPDKLNDNTKL